MLPDMGLAFLPALDELDTTLESFTAPPFLSCSTADGHSVNTMPSSDY